GAEVLLRVQRAVLTDGVPAQQVEQRPGGVAEFAAALHDRGRGGLVVGLHGGVERRQQFARILRGDARAVLGQRPRLPGEEVAAALDAVARRLPGAADQARERVAGAAGAREAAPRVRRVVLGRADRIAGRAAERLVGLPLVVAAPVVAEQQLVGRQRDRLADRFGRGARGQRLGGDAGGVGGRTAEDREASAFEPGVVGL